MSQTVKLGACTPMSLGSYPNPQHGHDEKHLWDLILSDILQMFWLAASEGMFTTEIPGGCEVQLLLCAQQIGHPPNIGEATT